MLLSRLKIFWKLIKSAWKLAKDITLKIQGTPLQDEAWVLLRTNKGNIITSCYNPNENFRLRVKTADQCLWTLTFKVPSK